MSTHSRSSGRAFYSGLLEALIEVMGSSKGYLFHHGPRVALLAMRLGQSLDLDRQRLAELFFGAVLADLGMIGLVEDAWENPVPELSPEARTRVMEHPIRSEETVRGIPFLEPVAPLVRHHHEWWDGSGYPDGLEGEEISVGARILRLADTVAALGASRPHRDPLGEDEIRRMVERGAGIEFGPDVAEEYLHLQAADEIHAFEPVLFRRTLLQATSRVVPEEVSPLSIEELLAIFATLIDAKDPYTAGHSRRVAHLARAVVRRLDMGPRLEEVVWAAGHIHDLGKVQVPLSVLTKNGRLDDDEFAEVRRHPTTGARILEGIPSLKYLTPGCRYHHERWDGRGYPEGLSEDRIPLVAQVLAVCDTYDAMTSDRAYRTGRSHEEAMEEIRASTGSQLSPQATRAFLELPDEVFRELERPGAGAAREPLPFLRAATPAGEA